MFQISAAVGAVALTLRSQIERFEGLGFQRLDALLVLIFYQ